MTKVGLWSGCLAVAIGIVSWLVVRDGVSGPVLAQPAGTQQSYEQALDCAVKANAFAFIAKAIGDLKAHKAILTEALHRASIARSIGATRSLPASKVDAAINDALPGQLEAYNQMLPAGRFEEVRSDMLRCIPDNEPLFTPRRR